MARVRVLYDGECPFCSAYARFARLRQRHELELLDAREARDLVRKLRDRGYDIDEGMIVLVDGEVHHGDDAAAFLELESRGGWLASSGLIRAVYPWLYRLRGLALRALGRDLHVDG